MVVRKGRVIVFSDVKGYFFVIVMGFVRCFMSWFMFLVIWLFLNIFFLFVDVCVCCLCLSMNIFIMLNNNWFLFKCFVYIVEVYCN